VIGPHCIRVTAYWGGYEELDEVYVIGPYPTAADRDADLHRISGLKDMYGSATLTPSKIAPEAADYAATPAQVAGARSLSGLTKAFYR
jgi:hypothetical protein